MEAEKRGFEPREQLLVAQHISNVPPSATRPLLQKHEFYKNGGGELGIRTPGGASHNGFQDRRHRPLGQFTANNITNLAVKTI